MGKRSRDLTIFWPIGETSTRNTFSKSNLKCVAGPKLKIRKNRSTQVLFLLRGKKKKEEERKIKLKLSHCPKKYKWIVIQEKKKFCIGNDEVTTSAKLNWYENNTDHSRTSGFHNCYVMRRRIYNLMLLKPPWKCISAS